MKKVCLTAIFVVGILLSFNIKAYAADAHVNASVVGEVKEGNEIEIVIDLENMTNLYCSELKYTYDNTLIKVEEISVSKNILGENYYPVYDDTAFNGNTVRYAYTLLGGDLPGFTGNSNFATIKAKVLKDGDIVINKDNFKMELVKKQGDTSYMEFTYNLPGESWDVPAAPSEKQTYTKVERNANNAPKSVSDANNNETAKNSEEKKDSTEKTSTDGNEQSDNKNSEDKDSSDKKSEESTAGDKGYGMLAFVALIAGTVAISIVVIRKKKK